MKKLFAWVACLACGCFNSLDTQYYGYKQGWDCGNCGAHNIHTS